MEDHFLMFIKHMSSPLIPKPVQKIVLDPSIFERIKKEMFDKYKFSMDDPKVSHTSFRLLGVQIEKGR